MRSPSVPSPTVPDDVRLPLLQLASSGVTTVDAAAQLGLERRDALRYFDLLRVAGAVHLRATDGPDVEWKTSETRRSI